MHTRKGDCMIAVETQHAPSAWARLTGQLESRFYRDFLPLVLSEQYAKRILRSASPGVPTWKGHKGRLVLFYPAPPKISQDPRAKPDRLGRVIKRLAWCY